MLHAAAKDRWGMDHEALKSWVLERVGYDALRHLSAEELELLIDVITEGE
jgi:hypothetical protein